MASKTWSFPLFYWDFTIGIIVLSLLFGFTLGSNGENGQAFIPNLQQASTKALLSAFIGGAVFNIANLLLVAAISITGLAIAFPIGIGIALVLGVIVNYMAVPVGNPWIMFAGVALVTTAIVLDAFAYKQMSKGLTSTKGIVLSLAAGITMGFFFRFVAASMSTDFVNPIQGLLTPYSAVFVFSIGVFVSNFLFNTYFMYKPIAGRKSTYKEYVIQGSTWLHLIGILGGVIWCMGISFSLIASEKAGFAISYGLGQGATMIASIWGVFVWKEFKNAPRSTTYLLALMFVCFIIGLGFIIVSRFV